MDKEQAIHAFWSSLGIPAYEENSVPEGTAFPYITYQKMSGAFEDALNPTGSIWTRQTSWNEADALKTSLESYLGYAGRTYKIDGGYAVIKRGVPFAQGMSDDSDKMIKRYVINLAVEFLTAQ
jgi:hypothetical protein